MGALSQLTLIALIGGLIAGCHSEKIEKFPLPAVGYEWPKTIDLTNSVPTPDLTLTANSDYLEEPQQVLVTFTPNAALRKIPYVIYRRNNAGVTATRVAIVPAAGGDFSYQEDSQGAPALYYLAVGRTSDDKFWASPELEVHSPSDFVIPANEVYRGLSPGLHDRYFLRNSSRMIATEPRFRMIAGDRFESLSGTIESFDTQSPIPKVDSLGAGKNPKIIEIKAQRATGLLTVRAWGFQGVGDPDPRADSPGVKVVIQDSSNVRIAIDRQPGSGGRKRPVCVMIGGTVDEGCGPDWIQFITGNDGGNGGEVDNN